MFREEGLKLHGINDTKAFGSRAPFWTGPLKNLQEIGGFLFLNPVYYLYISVCH
jgi:hypothetical protein